MPGYDELVRTMRDLERLTPAIMDKAVADASARELPQIRLQTPHRTGRLAAATKTRQKPSGQTLFVNAAPYANTIHWGRKRLQGNPNVVVGQPFIYDTLRRDVEKIGRDLREQLVNELNKQAG